MQAGIVALSSLSLVNHSHDLQNPFRSALAKDTTGLFGKRKGREGELVVGVRIDRCDIK
jgi:hypothetical protein